MNKLLLNGLASTVLCSWGYYVMRDNFFILLLAIALISLVHLEEEDKLNKRIEKLEKQNE